MVRFRGNALGKVDDKGRIVFPAVFRDEFARAGEEDMTLVVKKSVQGNCLNLFTRAEWDHRCDQVLQRRRLLCRPRRETRPPEHPFRTA